MDSYKNNLFQHANRIFVVYALFCFGLTASMFDNIELFRFEGKGGLGKKVQLNQVQVQ